jgi:hypothetical protein
VTEKAEYSPGPVGGWTREERDHDLVKYGNAIRVAMTHQIEVRSKNIDVSFVITQFGG